MPNSRQTSVMASPSRSRATKRRRSSITELAFHGIYTSRRTKAESVTHVSGTFCHLCLGPLNSSADVLPVEAACFVLVSPRRAAEDRRRLLRDSHHIISCIAPLVSCPRKHGEIYMRKI